MNQIYFNTQVTASYIRLKLKQLLPEISPNEYFSYMDYQIISGRTFLKEELPEFVNNSESWFNSDILKNGLLPEYPSYIINSAAFGKSICGAFHLIGNGSTETLSQVWISGGLFNAGIASFDYILDKTSQKEILLGLINEEFLRDIYLNKTEAVRKLAESSEIIKTDDLRIVILLTICFFISLDSLKGFNNKPDTTGRLFTILTEMFLAERKSTSNDSNAKNTSLEQKQIINAKSVLPFRVFPLISSLAESTGTSEELLMAADFTGKIFNLADDIADLFEDLSNGSFSSISLRLDSGMTLKESIDTAFSEISLLIKRLERLLDSKHFNQEESKKFMQLIKMYIYSWIGEKQFENT